MSADGRCGRCDRPLLFSERMGITDHRCPPLFHVHEPERHGNGLSNFDTVHAACIDSAIQAWAKDNDGDDRGHFIAGGHDIQVWARESRETDWNIYIVTGETIAVYRSRRRFE